MAKRGVGAGRPVAIGGRSSGGERKKYLGRWMRGTVYAGGINKKAR